MAHNTDRVAAEVAAMASMLERHGPAYTGHNVLEEAQGWIDAGFSADEAGAWCEIGCWDADTAATWRDDGLTPDQVRDAAQRLIDAEVAEWDAADQAAAEDDADWQPVHRHSQYTDGDPIYSACNGDTLAAALVAEAK